MSDERVLLKFLFYILHANVVTLLDTCEARKVSVITGTGGERARRAGARHYELVTHRNRMCSMD